MLNERVRERLGGNHDVLGAVWWKQERVCWTIARAKRWKVTTIARVLCGETNTRCIWYTPNDVRQKSEVSRNDLPQTTGTSWKWTAELYSMVDADVIGLAEPFGSSFGISHMDLEQRTMKHRWELSGKSSFKLPRMQRILPILQSSTGSPWWVVRHRIFAS